MLITSDNHNCSTLEMLRNRISYLRGIVIIKAKMISTSQQSAFFFAIYKYNITERDISVILVLFFSVLQIVDFNSNLFLNSYK